jgi:DNA replication protein DnaC
MERASDNMTGLVHTPSTQRERKANMSEHPITSSSASSESPSNLPPTLDESAGAVQAQLVCDVHGKYIAWRAAGTPIIGLNDCPRCIDERRAEHDREARERSTKQLRQRKMRQLVDIASIPPRFTGCTFDGYLVSNAGQHRALTTCRAYAASWAVQSMKGGSLVLTGGTGTGKTRLACTIANVIIPEHMASVAFGTVSSVVRTVRATYGKSSTRTESEAINALLVPDLLIIDEIGASTGSEHELGLLFEIINKRYENLRPMILISNLNVDDLRKFLGQRAMDRFAECGDVLAFDWQSYRAALPLQADRVTP